MAYTDWVPILEEIPEIENKTILELGCGVGTRALIDRFKLVHTWETASSDTWWNYSKAEYSSSDNWRGYFQDFKYWGFDKTELSIKSGSGGSWGRKRDLTALDKYWEALTSTIDMSTIDVAFVDQGFHLRGETVLRFMELGIPYIFWHDAKNYYPKGQVYSLYGWHLIKMRNTPYKVLANRREGKGTILVGQN